MNNVRGQVLVIFVIILPMMLLLCGFIIDSSYMLYAKNRLDSINRDVLNSLKNDFFISEEKVSDLIISNDARIVNDDIAIDKTITIDNHMVIDSFFGRFIGFKTYRVNSNKSVTLNDLEILVLDIDSLIFNSSYSIENDHVTYSDGLVFDHSKLRVKNFHLHDQYSINMVFSYDKPGNLLKFNDLSIDISDDGLLINGQKLFELQSDVHSSYELIITDEAITLNGMVKEFANVINNHDGDLIIGNGFTGKMDYIKIYSLRK